jgi:hypothetical protein
MENLSLFDKDSRYSYNHTCHMAHVLLSIDYGNIHISHTSSFGVFFHYQMIVDRFYILCGNHIRFQLVGAAIDDKKYRMKKSNNLSFLLYHVIRE